MKIRIYECKVNIQFITFYCCTGGANRQSTGAHEGDVAGERQGDRRESRADPHGGADRHREGDHVRAELGRAARPRSHEAQPEPGLRQAFDEQSRHGEKSCSKRRK